MKLTKKIAITGALLAVMAAPAYAAKNMANEESAQKARHVERHPGRGMAGHGWRHHAKMGGHGSPMTFDTNGDGRVTQTEIDEFRNNRLAKFDADGDGRLTLSEYEALWLSAMREKMVDRFQYLDADGDALITVEEFKKPYANMVRSMDKNGDGVLTREHKKKGG